jgi:ABC-type transporter Mla MlaB component
LSAPEAELAVHGPIEPEDVDALVVRVERALDRSASGPLTCDVAGLSAPDLVAMDALARMQLAARTRGRTVRLRGATRELAELLVICGLWDVFPIERGSGFEAVGQPEQREQRGGVEERVDRGDPPV